MIHLNRYIRETLFRKIQSLTIMALLMVIPCLLGYILFGAFGLMAVLLLVLLISIVIPSLPPDLIMKSMRARPLGRWDFPELQRILAHYAKRAELDSSPQLYMIPSNDLNAVASGNSQSSAIGITKGLMELLNLEELCGVVAHELAHIKKDDNGLMRLAQWSSVVTTYLLLITAIVLVLIIPFLLMYLNYASLLTTMLMVFTVPVLTKLLIKALSRSREYGADLFSAEMTGNPMFLASALSKMDKFNQGGLWGWLSLRQFKKDPWLRTHPDTKKRIAYLHSITNSIVMPNSIPLLQRPAKREQSIVRQNRSFLYV